MLTIENKASYLLGYMGKCRKLQEDNLISYDWILGDRVKIFYDSVKAGS